MTNKKGGKKEPLSNDRVGTIQNNQQVSKTMMIIVINVSVSRSQVKAPMLPIKNEVIVGKFMNFTSW